MENFEIYDLAANVTNTITQDLSEGIYKDLGGSLSVAWSDEPLFNASAESKGEPNEPPQHKIILNYEMARQIYRDAELYLDYAKEFHTEKLLPLFGGLDFASELPKFFRREDSVKNMFIGALTWVYFHERAHLWQEHGYIRREFGDLCGKAVRIEECSAEGGEPLKGKNAALWHATELAADFEATNTCLNEIIRHFAYDAIHGRPQDLTQFRIALYLLTCGISCACYRFYGIRPVDPEQYPTGSHPNPIRRLEFSIPNMFGYLDLSRFHEMDRRQLVSLCGGAAYSCGFYFLGWIKDIKVIPENYMVKGLVNDPFRLSYWREIVNSWDEIEPTIKNIRRAGTESSLLHFAPDFRLKVIN